MGLELPKIDHILYGQAKFILKFEFLVMLTKNQAKDAAERLWM